MFFIQFLSSYGWTFSLYLISFLSFFLILPISACSNFIWFNTQYQTSSIFDFLYIFQISIISFYLKKKQKVFVFTCIFLILAISFKFYAFQAKLIFIYQFLYKIQLIRKEFFTSFRHLRNIISFIKIFYAFCFNYLKSSNALQKCINPHNIMPNVSICVISLTKTTIIRFLFWWNLKILHIFSKSFC